MEIKRIKSEHLLEEDSKPPSADSRSFAAVAVRESYPITKTDLQLPVVDPSFIPLQEPVFRESLNKKSNDFRRKHFPGVSITQWNSWQWQLQNRIRTLDTLKKFVTLNEQEEKYFLEKGDNLPLSITPYYAHLIDNRDADDPIRKTVVPVSGEMITVPGESADPLGEDSHSPVPGIVHRYPDRVLFLITDFCSVYCRYCTRSRLVGGGGDFAFSRSQWEAALQYIEATPSVRDVLISGGDPLTLSDERLEYLLRRLKTIPHVEFVRIGTKVPVVLPQRITPNLIRMLKRYHPLWMSLNFVHGRELTPEVAQACSRLANAGIPLGSQTVLMQGINDRADILKELFLGLLKIRVRPYYLYQCDPIQGSSHFRTSVEKGLEIMQQLRGFITGYAVPTYVVDAPGGGGKIPVYPQTILNRNENGWTLQNYEGKHFTYIDPKTGNDNQPLVGITYDLRVDYLKEGYSPEETAEFDTEDTIAAIESALQELGYRTERIGHIRSLTSRLARGDRWDIVFNIAEGLQGAGRESQIPMLLDAYNIPYTFSDPLVLAIALHKGIAKRIVRDRGIPTPDFAIVENEGDIQKIKLPYPLFVKPVAEGTGKGISNNSLVRNKRQLTKICKHILNHYRQPALVEVFLPGREFTVGVVGTGPDARIIGGVMEVLYTQNVAAQIYSYHNKENYVGLMEYRLIDGALAEKVKKVVLDSWRGLNCRDGGRVDIRCDQNENPYFLEVNPLAGINPVRSDLPIACRMAGVPYIELIRSIMESAHKRLDLRFARSA